MIKNDLCLTWLSCLFILHQSLMTSMTRPGLWVNFFWTLLTNMPLLSGQLPYITPEWRRAIRHRNRLWKKYRKLKTEANLLAYKRQRNLCTSLRRKAITGYFYYKTNNLSSNPKEFWKLFRPLFSSKKEELKVSLFWRMMYLLQTNNV